MNNAWSPIAVRPHLLDAPARIDDEFGIYIHIPFCAHICSYCDFNTYAGQSNLIPSYVRAISREMDSWARIFDGRTAGSIYIGGGTPSLLSPDQISDVLANCRTAFDLAPDVEITLEANPNNLDQWYCCELLRGGVNRLSIGAQTLHPRGLRVLGRLHEAEQIAGAMRAARRAGFNNVSLDLIYAWPGQTLEGWRSDLSRVLSGEIGGSAPEHLSLYGLIVEPGTPMADAVRRGILNPIADDTAADFYELATALLTEGGWLHYEIANWTASPETPSKHNAVYWRNGEYAGIGAGAHGHHQGQRTMNQPWPKRYVAVLEQDESPVTNVEQLDARTAMGETMMLGLRLLDAGVSAAAFQARYGISLEGQFGPQILKLTSLGLLADDGRRVRLTPRGALLANSVCAEFL